MNFLQETVTGTTQIKLHELQQNRLQEFSTIINDSSKATIAYDITSRGFGYYASLMSLLLMLFGLMFGITFSTSDNNRLFLISVIYLTMICESLQYTFAMNLICEGLMVSAERLLVFAKLNKEAELRTMYDKVIGLS